MFYCTFYFTCDRSLTVAVTSTPLQRYFATDSACISITTPLNNGSSSSSGGGPVCCKNQKLNSCEPNLGTPKPP